MEIELLVFLQIFKKNLLNIHLSVAQYNVTNYSLQLHNETVFLFQDIVNINNSYIFLIILRKKSIYEI